ncbi:MAG: replicative DNA helicase [Patescibacteria group bacterium]|nr:MAG: replicative DNA helicase [Patescibacteria group bacterium]
MNDPLKTPPYDLQAEKSVLGSVLIDPTAINLISSLLRSEFFYQPEHQKIFEAMLTLFEKQKPIDIITLKNELKKTKELTNIGGTKYLSQLIDEVPTSAYVEHYAQIVIEKYVRRKIISISSRLVQKAFEEEDDVKNLLDIAETEIFSLAQQNVHRDFLPIKDILSENFERLEKFLKSGDEYRGVQTGFKDLDKKLGGMQKANLIILAARPGLGKTSFALNIALNAALKQKKSIGFFSLEMSKEELVDRLLASHADVDSWKIKTGKSSDEEYTKIVTAMGELSDLKIYIDDTPGISIIEMRTKARKLMFEKGLDLIVVDYLQLADAGRRFDSRVQEVSFISQGLKNLARELQIPVLALSQLSRAVEQRGNKKPQLSDLRESGSIEQDADVVMFLYNEDDSDDLIEQNKRKVKLSIAKHRNGPIGEIDLMFKADRVKFYGITDEVQTEDIPL